MPSFCFCDPRLSMDISWCKAVATHCAASLRYALDGFKNSAGIDVRRGTMFGAVDISAARAFAMVSTTVGRSGCTFIFDMLVGQKPRRLRWGKKAAFANYCLTWLRRWGNPVKRAEIINPREQSAWSCFTECGSKGITRRAGWQ